MSFSNSESDDEDGVIAEINVTPLVDVMLVLLIIFMITAPMMTTGMRVDLPQARTTQPLDKQPLVITLAQGNRIQIGNDDVPRSDLVSGVKRLMAESNQIVHIKADRAIPYGEVAELLDDLARNGITRLSLVAEAKGRTGTGKP